MRVKPWRRPEFYVSILGGSIENVHHALIETPGCKEGGVLFVEFTLRGSSYQALNGGPFTEFTDAISLSVACDDQDEVDRVWEALISGGGRPVQCGWLMDRYGVSWQIVPRRLLALLRDPIKKRAAAPCWR